MPPRGARPPDPHVLSGLDPSHRELVELLYRLYEEQHKRGPRALEVIGREAHLSKSVVSEALHGTGRSVLGPTDARRLAEVLGGTATDLNNAERMAVAIQPRPAAVWALGGDDAPDHLAMRATGRRPGDGRGGDLFTGRARAVDRIRQWLQTDECPGTALVVTGQPGAGKSSVVARAVRDLEADSAGDGLFFHARGGSRDDLLNLVRRQTRDDSITGTEGWGAHLQRRSSGGRRPLLIVVDALDEAVSGSEITRISHLLTSIAAHPAARVVVATRRGLKDQLLHGLGARTVHALNLVDLDSDTYFDPKDLQRVAARHLAQDDVTHPGPPVRAWTQYRSDDALTGRLAAVIARRAGRNFLVAAFAAHSLSTATEVLDPAAPGFDEKVIPSSVAEAFTKYFDTIPDERRQFQTRRLLTALAFAYGPGLDDDTWMMFAAALGLTITRDDILQLRQSSVADYLLETHPAEPGHPVRTRLYHQALIDQLSADAEPDDGHRILRHLTPTDENGWATATSYVRSYLIDHAAADSRLLDLLSRPGYLSVADLKRVLATLPAELTHELREITAILRLGITGSGQPTQLHQTLLLIGSAGHLGLGTWYGKLNQLAATLGGPTLLWAHSIASAPHQILGGHGGLVYAVATGRLGDRDVIVDGSDDGTIRIWDEHGNLIGHPLTGHEKEVRSVAVGRLGDRDVIVSGSLDGTIRIWNRHGDPVGKPVGDPSAGHKDAVNTVAVGRLGDRDVIVGGSLDGTIRIWDQQGDPVGLPLTGHDNAVNTVAVGRLGDRDVIVSGSNDGTIRIWNRHGDPVGQPFTGHQDAVRSVAVGRLGDRVVIVSGSDDGTIRIWDQQGNPVGQPLTGHDQWVETVAIGRLGDRDVIVSGSNDGTIRIWNRHGDPVGQPLTGHDNAVNAVAVGRLGDRDVIISGSDDGTIRIWNQPHDPIGQPFTGHQDAVRSVAVGRLGDRVVIVSGSDDGTIRIWDQQGNPVGQPLTEHDQWVDTVAIGRLGDRDVIVSGGPNGTIRIWDQQGNPTGHPLTGHDNIVTAVAIGRLGDRDVIVSGSLKGTIRIWDRQGNPIGQPLTGHDQWTSSVAIGRFGDRDVIVSGSLKGTIRIWNQEGNPTGKTRPVNTVAIGHLGDRDVIISGDDRGRIRFWDQQGNPTGQPLTGHKNAVSSVAIGRLGDRDVIVSGGDDRTIRIWDPGGPNVTVLPVVAPVNDIALHGSVVYAAVGRALVAWRFE